MATTGHYWTFTLAVALISSCVPLFGGCSHSDAKKTNTWLPVASTEPVTLTLANQNRRELTQYYSDSHSEIYENGHLIREKQEAVAFKVEAHIKKREKNLIYIDYKTLEKDGMINLNDLAFPEKGETLNMVLKPSAEVVKAGHFPRSSIFYVPPLSLPTEPVRPGATWEMNTGWVSMNNGIPLRLHLVTIFKNLYRCPNDRLCADFEISGEVAMGAEVKGVAFASDIRGRLLYSIADGTILWSLVRSQESFATGPSQVLVKSCLQSALQEPAGDRLEAAQDECQAKLEGIELPLPQ